MRNYLAILVLVITTILFLHLSLKEKKIKVNESYLYNSNSETSIKEDTQEKPPITILEEKKEHINMAKEGVQEYSITQIANSPQFYKAIINPEKVSPGETQTMTVYVRDDKDDIESVKAEIETDTKTQTYELSLVKGDRKDGIWEKSWKVNDTSTKTYRTKFIAKNKIGEESQAILSWTDPGTGCIGQNCTVSSGTITISGVDGADGGTMTINGGSVTVPSGATLIAAALSISGGTLAVNSGGIVHIASGNTICMTDADSDNYPANTTQIAYCSSGRRRYLMASVSQVDCHDGNSNVRPNQTACFTTSYTTPGGSQSYDYNCNGSQDYCGSQYYTLGLKTQVCFSARYNPRTENCEYDVHTKYYANQPVSCGQTGYLRGNYVEYRGIKLNACNCQGALYGYFYELGAQGTQACN